MAVRRRRWIGGHLRDLFHSQSISPYNAGSVRARIDLETKARRALSCEIEWHRISCQSSVGKVVINDMVALGRQ